MGDGLGFHLPCFRFGVFGGRPGHIFLYFSAIIVSYTKVAQLVLRIFAMLIVGAVVLKDIDSSISVGSEIS